MVQPPIIIDTVARDQERRRKRIRHLSRLMAVGCLVTSVMLTSAMLLYWTLTPAQTLFSQAGISNAPVADIDVLTRTLAFTISMIPLGTLIYGFLNARRCFAAFAAGQIFSSEQVKRLKAFSIAAAVSGLLKPLAGAALSVLLSFSNLAGRRTLALNIGSDTLIVLIFAGTVAVIAWVMAEAIDISNENKQFV